MARKKAKANYFTKETEEYIVRYNESTDQDYRNKIFTDHIYIPFYKLSENIIHTFKFYYTDVDKIEDLKHELVAVLLEEKIMKFDPTNGAKAYSYFGTIVKRWLINYNNKNYKKLKKIGQFSEMEESFEKSSDRKIADAILVVFRTRNDIEIFKKKALYIYIREMTDCDTPTLTKVVNVLKKEWYSIYQKMYDQGLLSNRYI